LPDCNATIITKKNGFVNIFFEKKENLFYFAYARRNNKRKTGKFFLFFCKNMEKHIDKKMNEVYNEIELELFYF